MTEKIIVDTLFEQVKIRWDGVRFSLIKIEKLYNPITTVTILNAKEMLEMVKFASTLGKE